MPLVGWLGIFLNKFIHFILSDAGCFFFLSILWLSTPHSACHSGVDSIGFPSVIFFSRTLPNVKCHRHRHTFALFFPAVTFCKWTCLTCSLKKKTKQNKKPDDASRGVSRRLNLENLIRRRGRGGRPWSFGWRHKCERLTRAAPSVINCLRQRRLCWGALSLVSLVFTRLETARRFRRSSY